MVKSQTNLHVCVRIYRIKNGKHIVYTLRATLYTMDDWLYSHGWNSHDTDTDKKTLL